MKVKKYKAYWHAWHEPYLINFLTAKEYVKRVEEIKTTKPKHEIPIRLRLFQPVQGKSLVGLKKAYAKQKEAYAEWEEAITKQKEADAKWLEAYAKQKEAYAKHLPEIEKLHTKECGCKEWNGRELIFPKRSDKK